MNRRNLLSRAARVGILAATTMPVAAIAEPIRTRGDKGKRLPDHAEFWQRLPLPFTPSVAWRILSPETQAEIGAAVVGMVLAEYISGIHHAEHDQFHDNDLRDDADTVAADLLNRITLRLWAVFADLFGPDGEHPRWALEGGLAS